MASYVYYYTDTTRVETNHFLSYETKRKRKGYRKRATN